MQAHRQTATKRQVKWRMFFLREPAADATQSASILLQPQKKRPRKGVAVVYGLSLTRPAVVKGFLHFFLYLLEPFLLFLCAPMRSRRNLLSLARSLVLSRVHPTRSVPCCSSLWCCPPTISSISADHDELFDLPALQGGG